MRSHLSDQEPHVVQNNAGRVHAASVSLSSWPNGNTRTTQAFAWTIGSPPTDSKVLFLKTAPPPPPEHREGEMLPTCSLHPYCLGFLLPDSSLYLPREKHEQQPGYDHLDLLWCPACRVYYCNGGRTLLT